MHALLSADGNKGNVLSADGISKAILIQPGDNNLKSLPAEIKKIVISPSHVKSTQCKARIPILFLQLRWTPMSPHFALCGIWQFPIRYMIYCRRAILCKVSPHFRYLFFYLCAFVYLKFDPFSRERFYFYRPTLKCLINGGGVRLLKKWKMLAPPR